jgi:hypothetical protein
VLLLWLQVVVALLAVRASQYLSLQGVLPPTTNRCCFLLLLLQVVVALLVS